MENETPKGAIDSLHFDLKSPVEDITVVNLENETLKNTRNAWKMYIAAFSALLMAVTMGLAVGYSSPATYDMSTRSTSPIKPSKTQVTWIGSMLALGAMTGGLIAGPMADKLGRKTILVFNVIPFLVGWFLIGYANNVAMIIAGRLWCGIACGIVSVAVPTYCVEISTSNVRGFLGSSFQGFMVIGNLLSVVVGSYVTWENLALIGAGSATLGLVCFFRMPESPRWLIMQENIKGAVQVLQELHGESLYAEEECNKMYMDIKNQPKGLLTLKECENSTIYKPAIIAIILMMFQQFSGANVILFYSSSIFDKNKEFMNPKTSTIILGVVQVVATLLCNVIVDKAGRKILLVCSGLLMFVSSLALGLYYYFSATSSAFEYNYNWLPLASLALFMTAFSLGYGGIPWLLAVEMVPLRARSMTSALATFSNGLSAFTVTKTFSELQDLINIYGVFWTYGCLSFIGCIFVILVVPETKGKALEEISVYFSKIKTDADGKNKC